jgi:hypothetical protein
MRRREFITLLGGAYDRQGRFHIGEREHCYYPVRPWASLPQRHMPWCR